MHIRPFFNADVRIAQINTQICVVARIGIPFRLKGNAVRVAQDGVSVNILSVLRTQEIPFGVFCALRRLHGIVARQIVNIRCGFFFVIRGKIGISMVCARKYNRRTVIARIVFYKNSLMTIVKKCMRTLHRVAVLCRSITLLSGITQPRSVDINVNFMPALFFNARNGIGMLLRFVEVFQSETAYIPIGRILRMHI